MYELTGIQFLSVNTVFQLYAMVRDHSPQLEHARDLLFIPDLFNYFLTGRRTSEYTFATTSQLLNLHSQSWEVEIFRKLGLPASLMQAMALGRISSLEELRRIVRDSFELALYEPQESSEWQGPFEEFRELCEEANR